MVSGRLWVQASERADSRCADYCPHSGGSDSHVVIQQWYQRTKFTAGAQPGDNGVQEMAWTCTARWMRKTPINTKELKFESQDGKTSPCKTHNVSLQETEDLTPGATKIVGKKVLAWRCLHGLYLRPRGRWEHYLLMEHHQRLRICLPALLMWTCLRPCKQ